MPKPALPDRYRVVAAVADYQRLMLLDDIWTDHLSGSVAPGDVGTLQPLTAEMDGLLARLQQEFDWLLQEIAKQPASDVEASLTTALSQLTAVSEEQKQAVHGHIQAQGGFLAAGQKAGQRFKEHGPAERQRLKDKIAKIGRGEHVPGDLWSYTKCGLSAIAILGGYWCPPIAAAGVIGALSYCTPDWLV